MMQELLPLAGFIKLVLHFRDMCLILGAKVGARESLLSIAIGSGLGVWPLLHSFSLHMPATLTVGMTELQELTCHLEVMHCMSNVSFQVI